MLILILTILYTRGCLVQERRVSLDANLQVAGLDLDLAGNNIVSISISISIVSMISSIIAI